MAHLNLGILLFLIITIKHLLYTRHGSKSFTNVNSKIPFKEYKIYIYKKTLWILVQKLVR